MDGLLIFYETQHVFSIGRVKKLKITCLFIPSKWDIYIATVFVKNWSEFDIVYFLCRCHITEIILQLIAQLVLLLLHVLAENHSRCLGTESDMTCTAWYAGCQLQMVKCLYILLLFIHTQHY